MRGVAATPMESLVVHTSQEGAGYTFNSAGGAYRRGVARPFEDKIRVAEIYLEMREIDPDVSTRAVSLAASVGKKFATKVVSEVESGALINPHLQVRYHAGGAGSLTILYKDGLLLFALWAKNNQTTLKLCNGMNNTAVFSETVIRMVATGFLWQGDVLILDNAAIHHYRESTTLGDYLWYKHGILITFLPTCAPELNPIEQMWNILMQRLKNVALLGPG